MSKELFLPLLLLHHRLGHRDIRKTGRFARASGIKLTQIGGAFCGACARAKSRRAARVPRLQHLRVTLHHIEEAKRGSHGRVGARARAPARRARRVAAMRRGIAKHDGRKSRRSDACNLEPEIAATSRDELMTLFPGGNTQEKVGIGRSSPAARPIPR